MIIVDFIRSRYYALIIKYTKIYREIVNKYPKKAIDMMWFRCYRSSFPWDNPVTLNEKIVWLSGKTDTSLWTKYSDKYEVRKHIEDLGLGHILTKCYGVWDDFDDIDLSKLPDSFVLKCTHDCGSTIVVNDKNLMNMNYTRKFIQSHLKTILGYETCEPHYTKIKPRIMAEEVIKFDTSLSSSIIDYKFWVFNGKCDYCMLVYDREPEEKGGHYILDLYEVRPWKQTKGLISKYDNRYNRIMPPPDNLDEMVRVAETIGKGFPEIRVDLYNVKGKIYFGEMTFTSQGGRMSYYTDEFQKITGEMIDLNYGREYKH